MHSLFIGVPVRRLDYNIATLTWFTVGVLCFEIRGLDPDTCTFLDWCIYMQHALNVYWRPCEKMGLQYITLTWLIVGVLGFEDFEDL